MKNLFKFVVALIVAMASQALAWSAEFSNENQTKLIKNIDSYSARMSEVALKIGSTPELGYQKNKTSALFQAALGTTRPELIAAAKAEFDKSRGAGFVYKPLIGERPPPLDYRNASTGADPG